MPSSHKIHIIGYELIDLTSYRHNDLNLKEIDKNDKTNKSNGYIIQGRIPVCIWSKGSC